MAGFSHPARGHADIAALERRAAVRVSPVDAA